jgi:hypothetical protein
MNAIISFGSALLFGTGMACAANRYPAQRAVLETVGGVLIIGGLAINQCWSFLLVSDRFSGSH